MTPTDQRMTTISSFLSSLGLDVVPASRRRRPPKPLTPAERRALEAAAVRHLPGPKTLRITASPRGREVTPSITMDHSPVKWHPDGEIRYRPGIPADLGLVKGPLSNRKISEYEAQGKYGPEAQAARLANNKLKELARRKTPRPPSPAEVWVRDVLGL